MSRVASFVTYALFACLLHERVAMAFVVRRLPPPFVPTTTTTSTMPLLSSTSSSITSQELTPQEQVVINVFNAARPSVVYISSMVQTFNPLLFSVMDIPSQSGSGFVWDEQHVVTNYHVIAGRSSSSSSSSSPSAVASNIDDKLVVTFLHANGTRESFRASVTGVAKSKDIAVLKLITSKKSTTSSSASSPSTAATPDSSSSPAKVLVPLVHGDSSKLQVGQLALAIGNPFALDHTLTTGVISGLGRTIGLNSGPQEPIFDMIQTDCAINPGNSGGPLLDSKGRLIGMNTAIYSSSGSSAGIGFAIPINTLKVITKLLIRDGKLSQTVTGLKFVGGSTARALGAPRGLVVLSVAPNSPAEFSGLRALVPRSLFASGGGDTSSRISLGDVVLAANGKPVLTDTDFFAVTNTLVPGDVVELLVERGVADPNDNSKTLRRELVVKLRLAK